MNVNERIKDIQSWALFDGQGNKVVEGKDCSGLTFSQSAGEILSGMVNPKTSVSFDSRYMEIHESSDRESSVDEDTPVDEETFLKKWKVICVTFPTSPKVYKYRITKEMSDKVLLNNSYFIIAQGGHNYRGSSVTIKGWENATANSYNTLVNIVCMIDTDTFEVIVSKDATSEEKHKMSQLSKQKFEEMCSIVTANNCLIDNISSVEDSMKKAVWLTNDSVSVSKETCDFYVDMGERPLVINDNKKKGDNMMNKLFSNIEFGKIKYLDEFRMTLKGLAMSSITDGEGNGCRYVIYDKDKNDVEDVTAFVIDNDMLSNFLYKMPVAIKDIKVGDIIFHGSSPVFVKNIKNNEIEIFSPATREVQTFIPTKNMFGFNFVTKVVNLMGNFSLMEEASEDNPFGQMLPLMMLSQNNKKDDMLPLLFAMNGGLGMENMGNMNPMMMYMLMDNGDSDLLPFLLMSQNMAGAQKKENN